MPGSDRHCCRPGCHTPTPKTHILCMPHFLALSKADRAEIRKRCFGWQNTQSAINWAVECFEKLDREQEVTV